MSFEEIIAKLPKPYYQDADSCVIKGDCNELLPGLEVTDIDLLLADPPYGMNYIHGTESSKWATKFNNIAVIGDNKPFDPSPLLRFPQVILWGGQSLCSETPSIPRLAGVG